MNNSITLILNSTQFVYFMGVVLKWQDNAITGVFRGQRSGEMGPIYVIDEKKELLLVVENNARFRESQKQLRIAQLRKSAEILHSR